MQVTLGTEKSLAKQTKATAFTRYEHFYQVTNVVIVTQSWTFLDFVFLTQVSLGN